MKLLLDTDVLLDVLTERHPHYESSARVLALIEQRDVGGLVAAHAVTTIHYLLTRHLHRRKAAEAIDLLLDLLDVAAVGGKTLRQALTLGWRDFEDAVTLVAAIESRATHLITRNTRDFRASSLRIQTPAEFLAAT